jgi:hypothetical protein
MTVYPVVVSGYGYGDGPIGPPPGPDTQEPPAAFEQGVGPQPPPPTVIINQYFGSPVPAGAPPAELVPEMPDVGSAPMARSDSKPTLYLIAMKDETIVAATGYWVQGEKLTYLTPQGNEKTVALSLIDKDLSERLNDERHVDFHM